MSASKKLKFRGAIYTQVEKTAFRPSPRGYEQLDDSVTRDDAFGEERNDYYDYQAAKETIALIKRAEKEGAKLVLGLLDDEYQYLIHFPRNGQLYVVELAKEGNFLSSRELEQTVLYGLLARINPLLERGW